MKLLPTSKYTRWVLINIVNICCIIICFILLLKILFLDTYSVSVYYQQKNELKKLAVRSEKLQDENKALEIEIDKLKNDPVYIESLARRNYSMVKKGEEVYLFKTN